MNSFARGLLLFSSVLAAGQAAAQSYPNRPIRLIIPLGIGGSSDVIGRLVTPRISELLGQSVIVDNRGGGAGLPGHELVAKATPDGYTLLLAASNFASNPVVFKKLPYDTEKDFEPIGLVAIIPTVLVVGPAVRVESAKELIALAKAKPGVLTYGSVGNGSGPHLTAEVFREMAGVQIEHVPYKGASAALTDLAAGRISFMFATTTSSRPFVTSGRVKPLAVSSQKRSVALPDVPALAESALPGFDVNTWLGILAPKGTPKPIVEQLNAILMQVLQEPKIDEQFKLLGATSSPGTPQQFRAHIGRELARWVNLAKTVKFEVAH
ncbi:MAG: tripartite tricarboxylate transporter substrate binding protein [Burkholderiales bacterium]|nr:tripartite tricarboxylate transporter substrate binding protein [Burkholderiales bacterium]